MYKLRPYNKYNDITEIEYSLKNYRNKMKKTAKVADADRTESFIQTKNDIMSDVKVAVEIMNSEFGVGLSEEDLDIFAELAAQILDKGKAEETISKLISKFKLKSYDELINSSSSDSEDPESIEKSASLKKTASFISQIKQIVSEALSPIETVKNYFYMLKQLWSEHPISKKIIALIAAFVITGLYNISPVDLLPEALLGPIGLLDDALSWFMLLPAAFKAVLQALTGDKDGGKEVEKIEQKEKEKPGFFSSLFGGGKEEPEGDYLHLDSPDEDELSFDEDKDELSFDEDEDELSFDNLDDDFTELAGIERKSYLSKLRHLTKMANKFDIEGNYKKADEIDKLIKKYM